MSRAGAVAETWGERLTGEAVAGTTFAKLRAACVAMYYDIEEMERTGGSVMREVPRSPTLADLERCNAELQQQAEALRRLERARVNAEQLRRLAEHRRHEELVYTIRGIAGLKP